MYADRARSDAVIIGGQTLRLDNPRLTTRVEGGHAPARIVVSRTLDLPEVGWMLHFQFQFMSFTTLRCQDANLWDVSVASTIVMVRQPASRAAAL